MYCTHKSSFRGSFCGILLGCWLYAAGCGPEPQMDNDIVETEAVYFEPIGRGSSAAFDTVTEKVIYDGDSWKDYQQYMETVLPFPDVDFSQLMVIFAAVPAERSGVTVQFESVEIAGDEVVASYVLGVPGPDCRVMDVPSTPFQVILLRRIDAPVRFERRSEAQPCTFR